MIDQKDSVPAQNRSHITNNPPQFIPRGITSIEDTGLSALFLQDLALKILYFQGYMTGYKVAEAMCLPFTGLVDTILDALKRDKQVEIKSAQVGKRRMNEFALSIFFSRQSSADAGVPNAKKPGAVK